MQEAFGVALAQYEHPQGSYRGREGVVTVPSSLGDIVVSVLGLDNRPAAQPHVRVAADAVAPRAAGGPYSPVEVATAYDFPADGNGTGECVAIIELGGGYQASDLQSFFSTNGIAEPTIVSVSVDGATNSPGGQADAEVALDIEVVGAVAPGARLAVYFAPNTDQGFLDAITTAAPRHHERPLGHVDQLGRGRIDLDRSIHDRDGSGIQRGGADGGHGLLRLG